MPSIKRPLPKWCSWNGTRIRFRRKGCPETYIDAEPDTPAFWKAYAEAQKGVRTIGASRTVPGSLKALVARYYSAPDFTGLQPSTQTTYRGIIERFLMGRADRPLARLERGHIKDIIGKMADRPQAANNLLKVLRRVLNYAVECGDIETNPAWGVQGYRKKTQGFVPWSASDHATFKERYPSGSMERRVYALGYHIAARRGDIVRLGRQHIQGNRIEYIQEKTGEFVSAPIHPDLWAEIEHCDNMTFVTTQYGAPFTKAGLGNWFRKKCDAIGLKGRSLHGLRKGWTKDKAEEGKSSRQIGAVTGHRTLKEIERYTDSADRKRLADGAYADESGTGFVPNETPMDKKAEKSS